MIGLLSVKSILSAIPTSPMSSSPVMRSQSKTCMTKVFFTTSSMLNYSFVCVKLIRRWYVVLFQPQIWMFVGRLGSPTTQQPLFSIPMQEKNESKRIESEWIFCLLAWLLAAVDGEKLWQRRHFLPWNPFLGGPVVQKDKDRERWSRWKRTLSGSVRMLRFFIPKFPHPL